MDFSQLGLAQPLVKAVSEQGYTTPSPIQQQAIPPVLAGRDLLGCAQTGTGKTAAFSLPLLQRLSGQPQKPLRVLILTPTRELAIQIGESITAYARHLPLSCCVIFGGVGQTPQVQALQKGPDILVATPGRLNDLMGQGLLRLDTVEAFVLDEADRMLDMGFIHDVKKVLAKLPAKRQTLLFSATMPPAIEELAAGMLHQPVFVKVTPPSTTVEAIRQQVCFVDKSNKRQLLAWLLETLRPYSTLVFTRTKHGADRVAKNLCRDGFSAAAIHGDKSQGARQTALANFKSGKIGVLVATDIAARGIDINELALVVNFDLPNEPETYVHRIGRTGRAGQEGQAVSFCCADEMDYLKDIQKLIRKNIPVRADHPFPMQPVSLQPQQPAAPAAKEKEREKEELHMEEQSTGAAKRRRKRSKKPGAPAGAPTQNAQPAQNSARAQNAPKEQPAQNRAKASRPEGKKSAPASREQRQPRPEKQAQPARKPRPAPQASRPADEEEDAGLLLISRRPPATKYANFEEYMKEHGGV